MIPLKVMAKFCATFFDRIRRRLVSGCHAPTLLIVGLLALSPVIHGAETVLAQKIVFLGDSLSAGYGVDPSEAFPALIQKKIQAAGWNDIVVNAGVSGDTSADGLGRINWLLKQRIDVLILELGGNDGLRGLPIAATQTNLQTIIDRVKHKYPEARIIIAGMQMPPNMGDEYATQFLNLYPDLSRANQADLIPFLLAGVGGVPSLNQADHIHPNVAGHTIVADNVWKVLLPVLVQLHDTR